jgi:hypothetical protein
MLFIETLSLVLEALGFLSRNSFSCRKMLTRFQFPFDCIIRRLVLLQAKPLNQAIEYFGFLQQFSMGVTVRYDFNKYANSITFSSEYIYISQIFDTLNTVCTSTFS